MTVAVDFYRLRLGARCLYFVGLVVIFLIHNLPLELLLVHFLSLLNLFCLWQSQPGSPGLFLSQFPVFSSGFLCGTVGPFLRDAADDGDPGLGTVVELVEALGEDVAGYLAVLGAGAGGLALDYDVGWEVFYLDGRVGFVLFSVAVCVSGGAVGFGERGVSLVGGRVYNARFSDHPGLTP